jgi:tRNA 2-thiocytidine biosynthesis protein TtcA
LHRLQGVGFSISKRVGKAITDYHMLDDGDKVCVALSGGKDSFTLLRMLHERRSFVPISYTLQAVHIDMGSGARQTRQIKKFCAGLGVPLSIEKVKLPRDRKNRKKSCFWCAWNRRKALFQAADRMGCSKVALGHHKDDIIETILLNIFFHAEISAMCPKQELFKGKIVIIRPLAYVEEPMIVKFASAEGLAHFSCTCPHGDTTNRARMQKIIASLEQACPDVKTNIFRSVNRIKKDYLL